MWPGGARVDSSVLQTAIDDPVTDVTGFMVHFLFEGRDIFHYIIECFYPFYAPVGSTKPPHI